MSEEEYARLLNQFPAKLHGVLNWKIYFNRLVQTGRRTGRTDIEIGDDIRKILRGQLDDRTIRAYLPPSMKHMEKKKLSLEWKGKHEDHDPHPAPTIVEVKPEPEEEEDSRVVGTYIGPTDKQTLHNKSIIEIVFDPAPIDRDRTQVFIIQYDLSTQKVVKYKTVGRRTLGR